MIKYLIPCLIILILIFNRINNIEKFTSLKLLPTRHHTHNYGPTYYKDPSLMTEKQKRKFLYKSKFEKMTIQDYINWLNTNKYFDIELTNLHKVNYDKYLTNTRLNLDDIPVIYTNPLPPPSAQSYYDQFINSVKNHADPIPYNLTL